MIYPIVLYGNSVLRERAVEIVKGEVDVKKLSEDMFETMHNADGIGLAAPQIGISKRIFVVDGSMLEDEEMKDFKEVFINPTIVDSKPTFEFPPSRIYLIFLPNSSFTS